MKRGLSDMTDAECILFFQRASTEDKRRALSLIVSGEVTVYCDPASYRDILTLIVRDIDLQTWGRLKCVCRYFRLNTPDFPPLKHLETLFSAETKKSSDLDRWSKEVRANRHLCEQYYDACVRRMIQFAYYTHPEFHLKAAMLRASPLLLQTTGLMLPFGQAPQALYPFGHVKLKTRKPAGNIFTLTWKSLLYIQKNALRFKTYRQMSDEQQAQYHMEMAQMKKLY